MDYRPILQHEAYLFGSSRLGVQLVNRPSNIDVVPQIKLGKRILTQSHYELSNHLGNVLTTVTGRKLGIGLGMTIEHYEPEVVQVSDYYAFGLEMPGRTYRNPLFSGTNEYRYGFNAKELDKSGEFGSLTHYDYGFRIYNPSIGKFLSVDPLTKSYPMLTPYQFASNRPIDGVDLDGLEYARAAGNAATENMTARDQSAAYIIPTPAIKPKVKVEQQVMVQDIHGNVINIPESQVQAFDANKIKEYKSIVLENIRTGGIVTSVTYLLSRDEALTFETRKWDNLLISATGIPNAKSSAFPKVNGNIKFPFIPNNSMNKAPLKLNGRVLIVDENLSPSLSKGLSNEGYNVMTFPKGTKDNSIIEFAQQNNAIVMTNNIKDFKKMGITTFEVHESLKTKEKIPEVISKVNNINNQASNQSDLIDKGNNVKIREF